MGIMDMFKGVGNALGTVGTLAGGVGGGAVAYATQAAGMSFVGHVLAGIGMGGISILSAPVLLGAVAGTVVVGGGVMGIKALSRLEGGASACANRQGFTDTRP